MALPPLLEDYNPWWFDARWERRDIHLTTLSSQRFRFDRGWFFGPPTGVVLIYGPRQVGKTVWIKQRIRELLGKGVEPEDILYLSGEGLTKEDLALLLKQGEVGKRKYVFIDEISSVEGWPSVIKRFYDAGLLRGATILTGSSSINLKRSGEQLPGRIAKVAHFYPLSFRELLSAVGGLERSYRIYREAGGFPRAIEDVLSHGFIREETFSIYNAWLDGETAKEGKSPRVVGYILSRVLTSLTIPISWSSIAKGALSHTTVGSYMEFLHDIFFLQWIGSFAEEWRAFVKDKKVYFLDPFLLHLARWRLGLAPKENGRLLEQIVFTDLLHRLYREYGGPFSIDRYLSYVKTKGGKEIDFRARFRETMVDIEVKSTLPSRLTKGVLYVTEAGEGPCVVPIKRFLTWEDLPAKWQNFRKTCQ